MNFGLAGSLYSKPTCQRLSKTPIWLRSVYKPDQTVKESENIAETTITDLGSELEAKKIANNIPSNVKVDYGLETKVAKQRRQRRRPRRAPRTKPRSKPIRRCRAAKKGQKVAKKVAKNGSQKKNNSKEKLQKMSLVPEKIDWFEVPDVIATTISRRREQVQPSNFVNGIDSDLVFDVGAKDTEFTGLNLELSMKVSLIDEATGHALPDTYPCAPINLAALTCFETANLYIGDKQIEGGNKQWGWKVYLSTEYIYSDSAKDTWMGECFLRARDSTGQFNNLMTDDKEKHNAGFFKRFEWLKVGRKVSVRVPLLFDIARTERCLPSGVPMRIELKRAPPEFVLMADSTDVAKKPRFKIENPLLLVDRIKLQPEIVAALRSKLESGQSMKFVYDRVVMTNPVSVPIGSTQFIHKITNGQCPQTVLAFFVDAKAVNGSFTNNCFLLDNMNVIECSAIFQGETYPTKPYSLKFDGTFGTKYDVTDMYVEMQRILGFLGSNFSNDIKLEEFAHDYTIFPFKLSPEDKLYNFGTPTSQGQVSLNFKFKEPIAVEKMLITACFYQSSTYVGRGGMCWTSFVNNTSVDNFMPGIG